MAFSTTGTAQAPSSVAPLLVQALNLNSGGCQSLTNQIFSLFPVSPLLLLAEAALGQTA
jgi:hypothetical protein